MLADELWVDVVHHHQLYLVLVDLFLVSHRNTQTYSTDTMISAV